IPVLLRVGIDTQNGVDKIYDGLMDNNIEIFNSSVATIYDLSILRSLDEITVDLSRLKTTMLDLFVYRKEVTLLETTKSISNITQDVPDFFNDNEYLSYIIILNLFINNFKLNYYINIFISGTDN